MEQPLAAALQRQIDDLVATVATNSDAIDSLTASARSSEVRADAAERRADDAHKRADRSEARSAIDRQLIAELQADGIVTREHIHRLEMTLLTTRTIGAAIGILMASRQISHDEALAVLEGASERTKMEIGRLAETIVAGAATTR